MDVTQIPFNAFLHMTTSPQNNSVLYLTATRELKNHLDTVHASAQFALAEACSGLALQQHFPELEGKVIPLLRKSDVKFKRPARTDIHAQAF